MSDPRTCATCTHWEADGFPFEEWEDDAAAHGMTGWHRCRLVESDDIGGYATRTHAARAFAYCADPYVGAELYTAPTFGCVQWEER